MSDRVRTLRIKKEYDQIIREDTRKDGVSINSFFNKLLEKYLMTYRYVNSFPCIIIPSDIIKEFLAEMPEAKIIKTAKKMGSYIPKHSLFIKRKDATLETSLELMEKVVSKHSNWYQFNSQNNNGHIELLLRHNLGKNWSIFLDTYYRTMFKQLFNVSLRNEVGSDSLVLKFSNTQKKSQ